LDQEGAGDDLGAEPCDEVAQSAGRPARRQQVVVHEYSGAAGEGIGVDLERIDAVLKRVFGAHRFVRQFARLAGRDEARLKLPSERTPEDESTGFGSDDEVNIELPGEAGEPVDRGIARARVEQQRRNVAE